MKRVVCTSLSLSLSLSSRSCRTSVDQLAGVANKLYPLSFYLLPANQKLLIRICGVKVYSWLWHFPFRFHCTPGKLNALRSGECSQLGNAGLKLSRKKKPKGLITSARSNLEEEKRNSCTSYEYHILPYIPGNTIIYLTIYIHIERNQYVYLL